MVVGKPIDDSSIFAVIAMLLAGLGFCIYVGIMIVFSKCTEDHWEWREIQECVIFADACLQWETRKYQAKICDERVWIWEQNE